MSNSCSHDAHLFPGVTGRKPKKKEPPILAQCAEGTRDTLHAFRTLLVPR